MGTPFGAMILLLLISAAIHVGLGSKNCLIAYSPIASPQRTGYPMSLVFSSRQTFAPFLEA